MTAGICNRIAIIDDDPTLLAATTQSMQLAGFEVLAFERGEDALEVITEQFEGVVLSDIRMPGIDGLEVFRRLNELDEGLPVILLTGHGDIEMAVMALKKGAYDFLTKPCSPDRLLASVGRAQEKRALVLENRRLNVRLCAEETQGQLIGESTIMNNLRQMIKQLATVDIDILIQGETGVGKSLVAKMLHELGPRSRRQMITLDCGSLPETLVESELFGHVTGAFSGATHPRTGRIEKANKGTLFLDEVDCMSDTVQQKFSQFLETRQLTPFGSNDLRKVDVRLVAASSSDLALLAQRGEYREALYYRINGMTINIPPLRERREDIPLLFNHFLRITADKYETEIPKITASTWSYLRQHDWPGNVRELQAYAERVALGIEANIFKANQTDGNEWLGLKDEVASFERFLLEEALDTYAGSVALITKALKLPRKTFYDKLNRYKIDIDKYRK